MRVKKPTLRKSDEVRTAEELLSSAVERWDRGALVDAQRLFLVAATMGDDVGQLNVGHFYDLGLGVRRNVHKARYWYLRAYKQGRSSAASNIATLYREQGNRTRAAWWFRRALEMGDGDSALELAKLAMTGRPRREKAVAYLTMVLRPSTEATDMAREEAARLLETLSGARADGSPLSPKARVLEVIRPATRLSSAKARRGRPLP